MSKIEWTDITWNMVTGCNKISPGCRGCYAENMHRRLMGIASQKEKYSRPFNDGAFPYEPALEEPFLQKKPAMFFSPSMSDLFHKNVPLAYIAKVWAVMYLNPQHIFQVLTKRADRLPELATEAFLKLFRSAAKDTVEKYLSEENKKDLTEESRFDFWGPITNSAELPLKNVWLGVSCEDQECADERIPHLMSTPAAVRFLSCEPLISPIDLVKHFWIPDSHGQQHGFFPANAINWVICGGESGHTARPMHPDWARSIRDQCKAAGVPFFFKQWGEYMPYESDVQPPFYFASSGLGTIEDGHGMNFCDPETGEAGRWNGGQWMDAMDSIMLCTETNSAQVSFLKQGKANTGNFLDGVKHLEFPNSVTA